jgi:hypothetical protein
MLLKTNKQAAEIISGVLGCTVAAVSDGRLKNRAVDSIPIYSVCNVLYCAPSSRRSPPSGYRWKRIGTDSGRDIFSGIANSAPAAGEDIRDHV